MSETFEKSQMSESFDVPAGWLNLFVLQTNYAEAYSAYENKITKLGKSEIVFTH